MIGKMVREFDPDFENAATSPDTFSRFEIFLIFFFLARRLWLQSLVEAEKETVLRSHFSSHPLLRTYVYRRPKTLATAAAIRALAAS